MSDEGKKRRDEGIKRVSGNEPPEFRDAFAKFFDRVPRGWIGKFEELRCTYVLDSSNPEPTSPNSWGALCMTLVKRGQLVHTGQYAASASPRSHACVTAIYRKP